MQTKARILCFALVKLHWKFVRRPAPSICVICRERNMLDLFSLPNMRSIFILTFARKFALKRQKKFSATCSVYLSYPEDKMFSDALVKRIPISHLAVFSPPLYILDEHPATDWLPEDIPEPLSTSWAKLLFRKMCDPTDPLLLKSRIKLDMVWCYSGLQI